MGYVDKYEDAHGTIRVGDVVKINNDYFFPNLSEKIGVVKYIITMPLNRPWVGLDLGELILDYTWVLRDHILDKPNGVELSIDNVEQINIYCVGLL